MAYTTTSVSTIRFDHIAIAVPRIAEATPFLVGELGGVPAYGAPAGAYRFGQWRFDGGGRLEILEPLGEDRSEEHTSELQSRPHLVCRLLLEKKKTPPLAAPPP